MRKQLSFRSKNLIKKNKKVKKILVSIIESSHHGEIHHILVTAKSLEIRGAEIKILVCNENLSACEVKSSKNINDKDPCWECRFGLREIIKFYNFEILTLGDFINPEKINEFRT